MFSVTFLFLAFSLSCAALKSNDARFLPVVSASPNSWTLIGACTGGRCPGTQSGTIKSSNYPENYPNKQDVEYTLETEQGSHIELIFNVFSLEDSIRGKCSHDYVKVVDSNGTDLATLCGENRPAPFKSRGNNMTIIFYSDASVNRRGFEATWKAIKNPSSGEFKSPNYPEKYPDQVFMTKFIEAPKGKRIQNTIEDFRTEDCCDFLEIVGVSRRIDIYSEIFSGKIDGLPLKLTSFTNQVNLLFISDFSVTR